MGSEQRQTISGLAGWRGLFRKRWSRSTWLLFRVIDEAFASISRSYGIDWGCGWLQGQVIWVVAGWRWGWGRRFWAGTAPSLAQLFCFCWDGGSDRVGGLRLQIGAEWEWWCGFVVVEAQRFGSTMVLPAIWYYDRAVIGWQLLVIDVLLVWIDFEEGFEVWKGFCCVVCWCLQMNGSSEFTRFDRG